MDRKAVKPDILKRSLRWVALAREARYHVRSFARLRGLSMRQLERECQQFFECSARKWLDERRCVDAPGLLKQLRSVRQVALRLGFKKAAPFSRLFKRYHGVSPTEFLRLACPPPARGR